MSELTATLQRWLAGGQTVHLDDVDIFYRVSGMSGQDLPWLVCFHGFPTSSWESRSGLSGVKRIPSPCMTLP